MALKSFETSLAINPENTQSILGIGVYHFETGNFKEARKYYEKALTIDIDIDPELKLSNIIAQSRARWLLEQKEELFY